MAITVSTGTTKGRSNEVWGSRRVSLFRVTLDTSNPAAGYAFDPKAFGHQGAVSKVEIHPRWVTGATGTTTRQFQYDHTNKKIMVIITSTGLLEGAGNDVSACVLDITVTSD